MDRKIHILKKIFWVLRTTHISFQDKIFFCSKIEDLLTCLKSFQSYLHTPVIILGSETLLRPKKQDLVTIFQKVT